MSGEVVTDQVTVSQTVNSACQSVTHPPSFILPLLSRRRLFSFPSPNLGMPQGSIRPPLIQVCLKSSLSRRRCDAQQPPTGR